MKRRSVFTIGAGICLFGLLATQTSADVIIKVRALNPLESEEVAAINYPLPEGVEPSDIVDKRIEFSIPREEEEEQAKTTFNIEYVPDEGKYFIIDEIPMKPREVVTLEVHVKDIWLIDQEQLEGIRQKVDDLINEFSLMNKEGEEEGPDETAMVLKDEISKEVEEIAQRQERSTVLKVGVEEHMDAYYENMEAMRQVEADVEMLRYLLSPEEEEAVEGDEEMQEENSEQMENKELSEQKESTEQGSDLLN